MDTRGVAAAIVMAIIARGVTRRVVSTRTTGTVTSVEDKAEAVVPERMRYSECISRPTPHNALTKTLVLTRRYPFSSKHGHYLNAGVQGSSGSLSAHLTSTDPQMLPTLFTLHILYLGQQRLAMDSCCEDAPSLRPYSTLHLRGVFLDH